MLISTILKILEVVPAVVARGAEFKQRIDDISGTLSEKDQATLKAAYADHIEESDEAHSRFQERLKELQE